MDTDEQARQIAMHRGDGSVTPLAEEAEEIVALGVDDGPKYPDVTVALTGQDGNAFGIMARVRMAIKAVHGEEAGRAYFDEAQQSQSYDALLQHAMKTVRCT